jgi:hypothetical protein
VRQLGTLQAGTSQARLMPVQSITIIPFHQGTYGRNATADKIISVQRISKSVSVENHLPVGLVLGKDRK